MRLRFLIALAAAAAPGGAQAAEPARQILYEHGRIVQVEQSRRPRQERFGYYELDAILAELRKRGFEVDGNVRPREATVEQSAAALVTRVRALLQTGAPPDRVTVVGASMGGAIALQAAAELGEPALRFCVLGVCLSDNVRSLRGRGGRRPAGRILAIREKSDEYTARCAAWTGEDADRGLSAREIVLDTGRSHGFLYRPLPEWVDPVVEWAQAP